MSYVTYDHADWVQRNIAAVRKRAPNAAERRAAADGRGWFAAPAHLSPDQTRMINILGIVGGGIYNAPIGWDSFDWNCGSGISVTWLGSLATFDSWRLSLLVFLCHDARVRCNVSACARQFLRITLHPRSPASASHDDHPNLADGIAAYRKYVPECSSVAYRADVLAEAAP